MGYSFNEMAWQVCFSTIYKFVGMVMILSGDTINYMDYNALHLTSEEFWDELQSLKSLSTETRLHH